MRNLAAIALVAACGGSDDYAIDPNHPPTTPPETKHDAGLVMFDGPDNDAVVVDAAPAMIAGRVCLYVDARATTTCQATGALNFKVTLGSGAAMTTAMTAADGTFSIAMPVQTTDAAADLLWHVTDASLETSVMRLSEGKLIPAITATNYTMLEDNNAIASNDIGTGAVIARITEGGNKLKGATADATPQQLFAAFYDGTNPQVWLQTATGAAGVAWFPDASLGNLTVTATYMAKTAKVTLPIEDQAITYTVIDLP